VRLIIILNWTVKGFIIDIIGKGTYIVFFPTGALLRMYSRLEEKCAERGLKMTSQRRVIAQVLSKSDDHPDVELLHQRTQKIDPKISMATVYRTVRLFEEAGVIGKHDFGDGRARYEEIGDEHHDHLIDMKSGKVIEFSNEEIEQLQHMIAKKLGYELIGHRLELYCLPLKKGA
jgi:Fur family ferric uptake transcriptional regulator